MSSPAPRRSLDTASPQAPSSARGYPFPSFDGSHGRPAGRQMHSRRTSTASSIGGVLDLAAHGKESSIAELPNNAISTLLQPPIIRTGLLPHTSALSGVRTPSTRDIPPVTLTNIPHVDSSVFKPYLAQAGSLYEAFRRAKDDNEGSRLPSSRRGSKADVLGELPGMQRRTSSSPTISRRESTSSTLGSPLEMPTHRRRSSGSAPRRAALTVAPLSTIPNVYFEQDFALENPRTFDIVSERAEIARPPSANGSATAPGSTGKKALATNAILQEKLSWYMDTVEIHLISSISTASTSFFAALGSLRELHSDAAESVKKIEGLREELAKLDKDMASEGLKILALKRRRDNLRKLGDAIRQLEEVVQNVTRCEEQVEKGEIEEALKGLTTVEMLIAGDSGDLAATAQGRRLSNRPGAMLDLRGIRALAGVGNDIAALRKQIGKAFETKFLDTLLSDIRSHIDSVPSSKTFQRWDKASSRLRGQHVRTPSDFPTYMQVDGTFRGTLLNQLKGLARSDSIMTAAITYKEAILREFKNLIRRHLPSSSDDDAESTTSIMTTESRRPSQQEKSSILARNLRALEPEDAEEMFVKIYSNVGEALRRLGTQVKVLLDITSNLSNPHPTMSLKSPPRSPAMGSLDGYLRPEPSPLDPPSMVRQEEIQQALDLSSLLGQAVDIAQSQIVKILKVRAEQSTHLELVHFLRYFMLNRLFADECEAVSGRGGLALKTVVNEHIKTFVGNTAETERLRLVKIMDADKWDAKDFGEDDEKRVALIIQASTKDVEAWTKSLYIWEEFEAERPNGVNGTGKEASEMNGHGTSDSTLNPPASEVASAETRSSTPLPESQPNGIITNTTSSAPKARSATIDEQKFLLPNSAISVSSGLVLFSHLLTGIPSMSSEISTHILEYLKLFNSRSSQLILGAGATKSAGLKNITTKHLALASQSLSFVVTLVPYVREFVRRRGGNVGSGVMGEFDRVKRLLQEHQAGIHDKLVDIMSGRAAAHINSMKRLDWNRAASAASGKDAEEAGEDVNEYMKTLVKETSTLHKVLSKHLPEGTVQMIMAPVMESYREQWGKAYGEVGLGTAVAKERLLRDAEYFRSKTSRIQGAMEVGNYLVDLVNARKVETPSDGSQTTNGS